MCGVKLFVCCSSVLLNRNFIITDALISTPKNEVSVLLLFLVVQKKSSVVKFRQTMKAAAIEAQKSTILIFN